MVYESFLVAPGDEVDLADYPTRSDEGWSGGKSDGKDRVKEVANRLAELQRVFYADGSHRLLVVLQAMDTGGKDSTIRDVFGRMNPQGVDVASFGVPTPGELAHDYLWRVHPRTPGDGQIVIFNRSHYEDVLVVRVENLVGEDTWRARFDQIVEFERLLAAEGTTIVKFFIHISKDEQKERLQARLDDPEKHWKFSLGDLDTRKRWDEYQAAYAEALSRTSTEFAPWYVIPGDRKWYRKLVIGEIMVDLIESLGCEYPRNPDDLSDVVIE
ncbi:MAG TPA: polyphosphate kinase 2 family protein [Acidimicrobiia bacterium]|nr:polyphosphate kinase 2 family protein [Acidimicrobiia bacterium]